MGSRLSQSVCVYYIMCVLGELHQLDLRVGIYKNVHIYQTSSNPIVSDSSSWSIDLLHKKSMFQLKSLQLKKALELKHTAFSYIPILNITAWNEPRRYSHLILSLKVVDFPGYYSFSNVGMSIPSYYRSIDIHTGTQPKHIYDERGL